jgi:aminocarboxymuconate-semialdehyde decarboxylase
MPVFLHPAYEQQIPEYATFKQGVVVGLPAEVTVAVERLICARLFDRYPNVNVVAGLGGGFFPYNEGRLRHYISQGAELAGAPTDPWSYVGRLKFDSFLHDVPALEFLIKKAGSSNVMIGTDCSFRSGTPTPVADVRAATNGNAAAFEQVTETNAHDLFWQYGLHS